MVERFLGPGEAAKLLGYSDRHVRRLRAEGSFPAPEIEIEETNRVLYGWHQATIEAYKRHLTQPDTAPFPTVTSPPRRFVGTGAVARRYGFGIQRGYQRIGAEDFPPHAVELDYAGRSYRGWDARVVEEYAPRLNRAPGRPPAKPSG